jgi:hypothetical protein
MNISKHNACTEAPTLQPSTFDLLLQHRDSEFRKDAGRRSWGKERVRVCKHALCVSAGRWLVRRSREQSHSHKGTFRQCGEDRCAAAAQQQRRPAGGVQWRTQLPSRCLLLLGETGGGRVGRVVFIAPRTAEVRGRKKSQVVDLLWKLRRSLRLRRRWVGCGRFDQDPCVAASVGR